MHCVEGLGLTASEVWVDTQDRLDQFLSSVDSVVGVDTEFVRRKTFFHEPALLQLAVPGSIAVIDLLAPLNLTGVERMLADSHIAKIAHGSSEDLELLRRCFGFEPSAWMDMQIAMSLLSTEPSISYTNLVERLFNISLPKEEQNSKWLKRPLDKDQIAYSASDVEYLVEIWQMLKSELAKEARLPWFEEDMEVFLTREYEKPGLEFRSIAGAPSLNAKQLQVLRGLCEIRLCYARSRNLPQNWLATDKELMFLASDPGIRKKDMIETFGRKKGERLLHWLQRAIRFGKQDRVVPVDRRLRERNRTIALVAELKPIVTKLAEELSVATQMLATNHMLNQWANQYLINRTVPTHKTKWRSELVAKPVHDKLKQLVSRQR